MRASSRAAHAPVGQRALPWARVALVSVIGLVLFQPAAWGQTPSPSPGPSVQILTPDPQRVFRLESEATLRERMTRDARLGNNPLNLKYEIFFPDYKALSQEPYVTRHWEPLGEIVDPPFVCYRRLYFQQLNFERYGWDLGILSLLLSPAAFYLDVATLPYHAATEPLRPFECNSGYCLPGDPTPLLLYPPKPSLTGALGEAAAVGLAFVFFP